MVVISGIGDSSITSENCLIGALPQARKYFEAHNMGRGRAPRRAAQRFETSSVPIKSHCWTSGVFPDRLDHLLCDVVTCSQALPHIHGRDESGRWVRADDQYRSLFNPDPSPFPTFSFPHLTLDHIRFAINKKSPSLKRKFVFQSSIFRGYVTLRGCICLDGSLVTMHFGIECCLVTDWLEWKFSQIVLPVIGHGSQCPNIHPAGLKKMPTLMKLIRNLIVQISMLSRSPK